MKTFSKIFFTRIFQKPFHEIFSKTVSRYLFANFFKRFFRTIFHEIFSKSFSRDLFENFFTRFFRKLFHEIFSKTFSRDFFETFFTRFCRKLFHQKFSNNFSRNFFEKKIRDIIIILRIIIFQLTLYGLSNLFRFSMHDSITEFIQVSIFLLSYCDPPITLSMESYKK